PLQVRVEKAVHAVRGHGKLAASIDTENTEHTERTQHDVAFQERSVIAEQEMVRAADRDAEPCVRRQTIINRLDVGEDLPADRVGRSAVITQEDHERSLNAFLNDAAERLTVHIDPGLTPGIVV